MRIKSCELYRTGLSARTVAMASAGLLAIAVFPDQTIAAVRFAAWNLVLVAPVMAIAVGVTAAITASGAIALIATAFRGRVLPMIGLAALIGALTPVCGISVLPLVAGLLAAGVPLAPIMAFWLSSPITSPEMLAITAATIGPTFALGKSVAAFLIGIFGGVAVLLITRAGYLAAPARRTAHLERACRQDCGRGEHADVDWLFWRDPARRARFGYVAMATTRLIVAWLAIAFLAEYFLRLYIPNDLIIRIVGDRNPWAVPLAAAIGMPIYLDGYAALPLVRGLIETGMGQGAAMAFLVAGGITSAWAAIPVFALVRLPVFVLYLTLAACGSTLAGWGYGLIVN